jgi:primary-amine oxidase
MSARRRLRRAAIGAGLALLVLAPAARAADAPLDPLSGPEIRTAIKAIEGRAGFPAGAFFPLVQLKEPSKAALLAWSPGKPFTREAFANVYDPRNNKTYEAIVDLKASPAKVTSFVQKAGVQPAVYLTEYTDADTAVREDTRWQHAMDVRGINPDKVYLDVWAPGDVELPTNVPAGTRLLRALSFFQRDVGEDTQQPTRTTGRSRACR